MISSISNDTVLVSNLNLTEEDVIQYLEELQHKTTLKMIPSIVYLISLSVVGLVGNSLVLFVYSRKFKRTSTRIFILSIACFDLITNVVAIPGEIYDLFNYWDFNKPYVCKVRLFFNAFTTMVAAMILVAVAVTRYRKICRPFGWQVTTSHAKIISVSLAVASLLFSVPYGIINGRQMKPTPQKDIHGYECTVDDSYVSTIWPTLNAGFFILLFLVCSIPLVVLYILIGAQAWKHRRLHGVARGGRDQSSSDKESSNDTVSPRSSRGSLPVISGRSRSYVKKVLGKSMKLTFTSDTPSVALSDVKSGNNNNCENLYDESTEPNNAESCSNKMFLLENKKQNGLEGRNSRARNYNGEKFEVNANMVRELTVKLKAVQKEEDSTEVPKRKMGKLSVTFNDNLIQHVAAEILRENGESPELHPSVEETEELGEKRNDSQLSELQAETHSDFSRAMNWVDITYCPPAAVTRVEAESDNMSVFGLLYKKGSVISLRKLSRDSSFLKKHRTFKEVINDTIVRARRAKKDDDDSLEDVQGNEILPAHNMEETEFSDAHSTSNRTLIKTENSDNSGCSIQIATDIPNSEARRVSSGVAMETSQGRRRGGGMTRTTCMLLIISLLYVLGFLPYLGLAFFKSLSPVTYSAMDSVGESLYNLFLRSYFLNSAANPIIYSLCDVNFRRECFKLLKFSHGPR